MNSLSLTSSRSFLIFGSLSSILIPIDFNLEICRLFTARLTIFESISLLSSAIIVPIGFTFKTEPLLTLEPIIIISS